MSTVEQISVKHFISLAKYNLPKGGKLVQESS